MFEATPFEIATAYTIFPNGGTIRPLRTISRLVAPGKDLPIQTQPPRTVARPDTTFLVTNMMRSVLNEGTGAGARAAGFALDAAGKTGTTNDLRDAWFVGFTPELLTVVWVGLDDNQPLGLSGTQAALPIWTAFMTRALAGRANRPFTVPDGIAFVEIDSDTGKLAAPGCPRVFREAFLQRHRADRGLSAPRILSPPGSRPRCGSTHLRGSVNAQVRVYIDAAPLRLSGVTMRTLVRMCT